MLRSLAAMAWLCWSSVSLGDLVADSPRIFTIGNSLTWDTQPELLDGNVSHHIACSRNLQEIIDHPEVRCLDESVGWDEAFALGAGGAPIQPYDYVTVQPFPGTTLQQDVNAISHWMTLQPTAVFVIHTGWAAASGFESEYNAGNPDDQMVRSPDYFADLISALKGVHPDRDLRSTNAIQVLDSIISDIEQGDAPYASLRDLYRDDIHLSAGDGRLLAHNAMRAALGQPLSVAGFDDSDPDNHDYLLSKVRAVAVPEPGRAGVFALVALIAAARVARRSVA